MNVQRHLIGGLLATCSPLVFAHVVTVNVENVKQSKGQVGCALFDQAEGFPADGTPLFQQWHVAAKQGVHCIFADVKNGEYAISVSHDENSNGEVDTNWLGIPKEAWGVTNNVRPAFRAPTFAEAAIEVVEDTDVTIRVEK